MCVAVVRYRDPGAHQRGPVEGQVAQLLDQVRQLVEARVVALEIGGEVPERVPVRAGTEVARLKPARRRLLRRCPRAPPVAAEGLELVEGAGAVDECAQLPDRLPDEALDRALGDHRGAVLHREPHRAAGQRQRALALLGLDPHPALADRAQHVLVLGAGSALLEWQIAGHEDTPDYARRRTGYGDGGWRSRAEYSAPKRTLSPGSSTPSRRWPRPSRISRGSATRSPSRAVLST